jgi:molybdopterin-guanine dinucleotide biosynthesis protein A
MPELSDALLIGLLAEAQRLNAPCLVAAGSDGQVHPLCGVYRADCLNEVEEAVAGYRLRLMDLIADLKAVKWRTELPLTNCNTPEEWSAISLV